MKIHEYQGKEVLAKHGVPVPRGIVITEASEARAAAEELGGRVVVKAQIHAGGRGKGGGVKLADNPTRRSKFAEEILGMTLVTKQTGPEGKLVRNRPHRGGTADRPRALSGRRPRPLRAVPVMMASREGGMDIEEVAEENPDAILKAHFDPTSGSTPTSARKLAFGLGLEGDAFKQGIKFMHALAKAYARPTRRCSRSTRW